jgi:hypothetical protein
MRWRVSLADPPQGRVRWLVATIFLALAAWYLIFAVQRYETSHLYGDEPEYFLMGVSVWEDGDLDLRNQFEDPDRRAFPGPLTFKIDPAGGPSPSNFMPTHGVLISQPVYIVFGLLGVLMVYAAINLLSLFLMFVLARRSFGDLPSILAVGAVGFSVPLAWHAASVWSEIPALCAVAAILAMEPYLERSLGARVTTGVLLAGLPWLHQKYGFLVAGLVLAIAVSRVRWTPAWKGLLPWPRVRRWRMWPWLVALPFAGALGTVLFSLHVQGRANFTQAGGDDITGAFDGTVGRIVGQPFAWFVDQTRGYIPYAPVWILAGVGVLFLLRFSAGREWLRYLLIAFTPYFLVYFPGPFLGGDAPPGRETLVALPALAVLLAAGFKALRGPLAVGVAAALTALSVLIGTVPAFRPGMDIFFNNVGQPKLFNTIARERWNYAEWWPRMTTDPFTYQRGALLLAVLAVAGAVTVLYLSSRLQSARDPWTMRGPDGEERERPLRMPTKGRTSRHVDASGA